MFNLEYMAASLGVNVEQGGLSIKEEELTVSGGGGSVTTSETPVAVNGSLIAWYKKPTDVDWTVGTVSGTTLTIPSSQANDHYCVKYFWQNEDARSILIKTQFVPSELHVVIINDLYTGDISVATDATRYGRLITDIPRLQMDGNQDLTLTSTGAATVSLTGSALAVSSGDTCEEDPYYGTMTEEIFGEEWENNVIALAIENSEISLAAEGTESLIVRVIYGGSVPSQRKDNSNFTFTIEEGTATGTQVASGTGLVTAGSTSGTGYVTVTLTKNPNAAAAIAEITVTG